MEKTLYTAETEFGPIRIIVTEPTRARSGPASFETIQKKVTETFEEGLGMAVSAAKTVLKSVTGLGMEEIAIETGLSVEAGLWGFAKGEAAISITMTWKKP